MPKILVSKKILKSSAKGPLQISETLYNTGFDNAATRGFHEHYIQKHSLDCYLPLKRISRCTHDVG
jgi:hypothetical protein